jgi:hypothetical protein
MRRVFVFAATVAVLLTASAAAAADSAPGSSIAEAAKSSAIAVVSSRAEHITDGDGVFRVEVPAAVSPDAVTVSLNGDDVTASFQQDEEGRSLVGLVTGLREGENVLSANAETSRPPFNARLKVHNSPTYGPIFSGPHQSPWICQTLESGLGDPPESGPCVAPTRYDWFYRTTAGQLAPYDPANPPTNLAQTTTIDGETVDYIVRVESGTIDQSIYRIAIIDDPANPTERCRATGGTENSSGRSAAAADRGSGPETTP